MTKQRTPPKPALQTAMASVETRIKQAETEGDGQVVAILAGTRARLAALYADRLAEDLSGQASR